MDFGTLGGFQTNTLTLSIFYEDTTDMTEDNSAASPPVIPPIDGQTLKMAVDIATASLIFGIQEHIGFQNPVSVEIVDKQPIRYGLRYIIEVKVDEGVNIA